MNTYIVTTPIAGHLSFEVEADSPEEAKQIADTLDEKDGELSWETLTRFNQGNVCYCPSPWEQTVELISED